MTGRNVVCVGGTRHNVVATGRKWPCLVKINWTLHAKRYTFFPLKYWSIKAALGKWRLQIFATHRKVMTKTFNLKWYDQLRKSWWSKWKIREENRNRRFSKYTTYFLFNANWLNKEKTERKLTRKICGLGINNCAWAAFQKPFLFGGLCLFKEGNSIRWLYLFIPAYLVVFVFSFDLSCPKRSKTTRKKSSNQLPHLKRVTITIVLKRADIQ